MTDVTLSPIRFRYCNAVGEITERTLVKWDEVGHYIRGWGEGDPQVRTFRKDRVHEYYDGCARLLRDPAGQPPPKVVRDRPADARPHILFTGFAKVQRATLESKADAAGLKVVQTVTQGLVFLCCGPNAGPSKVEKSRAQNVYVLTEPDLHVLMATGELPDSAIDLLMR